MQLYTLDPLFDHRWDDLVASHSQASVFHTTGWLRALANTYGYKPVVLTSTPPGQPLFDGIAFCEIKSWITGSRLVSLPFADHAEPLLNEASGKLELEEWVRTACSRHGWKYVELRPVFQQSEAISPLSVSRTFWLHLLSLAPSIEQLFSNLHKNCLQRRVRHAEREHLTYERGCSDELLHDFYNLLTTTRRRQRLLPQPRAWFENLRAEMKPDAEIRLARKDGVPVAAILTLRHRGTVVYKYGCSNERLHHVAGMPFLFWKLIEEGKFEGVEQIDFGRTDTDNTGLIEFKDRLGTVRRRINYLRYPHCQKTAFMRLSQVGVVGCLVASLPDRLSSGMGRFVYRHIG